MGDWHIYRGGDPAPNRLEEMLPPQPPPWRRFTKGAREALGIGFQTDLEAIDLVNAALYLRRPLLITGKPGTGKTTLAYAVAHELGLSPVLRWSITTRSTLQEGLYRYDAIARLHDASLQKSSAPGGKEDGPSAPDIGRYVRLGPLGSALLPAKRPRVLLIDEIDKSDIDLPNDLLHIFEEGEFEIPELSRLPKEQERVEVLTYDGDARVMIERGRVRCDAFPFVVLTSNGERDFPPAFLRRCLRHEIPLPDPTRLSRIVAARLGCDPESDPKVRALIREFVDRRDREEGDLATDQLLNAVYLTMKGIDPLERDKVQLLDALMRSLSKNLPE